MGLLGVLWKLSVLVAFLAVILLLPAFRPHRQKLADLLSTCPLHWFGGKGVENSDGTVLIKTGSHRLFTKEELSAHDGTDEGKAIYVAIYGRVFDVTSGKHYYGPGGGYHFFSGRDGTRAFTTGQFNEQGLVDDVTEIEWRRMLELQTWVEFYEKTYTFVGKVIGNFYDASGNPTEALLNAEAATKDAIARKQVSDEERKIFPPCNSHWSEATGARVWCSTKSGGIERDWEGLPRLFFDPTFKDPRCVCVRSSGPPSVSFIPDTGMGDLGHPNLRVYDDCDSLSNSCKVKPSH